MDFKTGDKYLITTDAFFFTPNGRQCRSVWGGVEVLSDDFLGIKTNHGSSNWFLKVGTDKNHVIIAGCQIHYAVKCDTMPENNDYKDWTIVDGVGYQEYTRPSTMYIPE